MVIASVILITDHHQLVQRTRYVTLSRRRVEGSEQFTKKSESIGQEMVEFLRVLIDNKTSPFLISDAYSLKIGVPNGCNGI
jgi:hypothetical protein